MIGVNTFGLTQKIEADMPGTFRAVKEAGFDAVELLVVPVKKHRGFPVAFSAEDMFHKVMAQVRACDLQVPSVHVLCSTGHSLRSEKAIIRTIRELHAKHGIHTFVFSGMFSDIKGARKWAKYIRSIADAVRVDGCKILYHNHTQEFQKVTVHGITTTALDYFLELVGEDIALQLDIGWAGVVADELALAQRYRERIVSIHLKDFAAGTKGTYDNTNMTTERFTAIGCGEIRTAEVLAIRDTLPRFNGSIIIDQDNSVGDMLDEIRTGLVNVKHMLQ